MLLLSITDNKSPSVALFILPPNSWLKNEVEAVFGVLFIMSFNVCKKSLSTVGSLFKLRSNTVYKLLASIGSATGVLFSSEIRYSTSWLNNCKSFCMQYEGSLFLAFCKFIPIFSEYLIITLKSESPILKTPDNIQKLVDLLTNNSRSNYHALLTDFDFQTIDFKTYQSWSKKKYTRNCLYKDANLELILLCWERGQQTPIHGHNGEDCWVLLIEGGMKEVFFSKNDDGSLLAYSSQVIVPNQITFMNDNQGYHKLENDCDGRSVSLHLYAKPIENCQSFDEKSKQFVERSLNFDSDSHFTCD